MDNYSRHDTALLEIILDAEKLAGEWNGDEPGVGEDKANYATEIAEKATELRELIDQLEEL